MQKSFRRRTSKLNLNYFIQLKTYIEIQYFNDIFPDDINIEVKNPLICQTNVQDPNL